MSYTIKKMPNGKYQIRVWAEHKDIYGKRKTLQKSNIKTIAVAENSVKILQDKADSDQQDYSDLTFEQLNNMYMQKRAPKMSPSTIDVLKRIIPSVLDFLGKVKVCNINTKTVQSYIDKLAQTKNTHHPNQCLKKGTLQRYYRHIQAVLNWGVGQDYVEINRVKRVEFPEDKQPFDATVLDAPTIGKMLAFFKNNFYNLYIPILLSVTMSPRRGEFLGLKWDAVNFDNGTIDICNNVIQVGNQIVERDKLKTPKSKRLLSMSDFVAKELKAHKEMCAELVSPYVCATIFTGDIPAPSYVTKMFHKIMLEEFGIDVRVHDLRHSFNQLSYENNIDDVTRSKIMGHSNTDITNNVYTHFSASKNKEAMNTISKAIEKAFNEEKV